MLFRSSSLICSRIVVTVVLRSTDDALFRIIEFNSWTSTNMKVVRTWSREAAPEALKLTKIPDSTEFVRMYCAPRRVRDMYRDRTGPKRPHATNRRDMTHFHEPRSPWTIPFRHRAARQYARRRDRCSARASPAGPRAHKTERVHTRCRTLNLVP